MVASKLCPTYAPYSCHTVQYMFASLLEVSFRQIASLTPPKASYSNVVGSEVTSCGDNHTSKLTVPVLKTTAYGYLKRCLSLHACRSAETVVIREGWTYPTGRETRVRVEILHREKISVRREMKNAQVMIVGLVLVIF
jgi:hypothetical protein